MTLAGEIFLDKEKIGFMFTMGEFGKKNVYFGYKGKMYDLRYLVNMFKTKRLFSAIKTYYDSGMFENHAKRVLDGPETKEYIFKFIDLVIKIRLGDSVEHQTVITKITELEAEFDEENEKFLIIAYTGNKIIYKENDNIRFFYRKVKMALGYYNSDLNKVIKLIGTYVNLENRYKIMDISGKVSSVCFREKKEKTLENFRKTGLLSLNHKGIIDNAVKEKLYEEVKDRLSGIISDEMLKKLVEY